MNGGLREKLLQVVERLAVGVLSKRPEVPEGLALQPLRRNAHELVVQARRAAPEQRQPAERDDARYRILRVREHRDAREIVGRVPLREEPREDTLNKRMREVELGDRAVHPGRRVEHDGKGRTFPPVVERLVAMSRGAESIDRALPRLRHRGQLERREVRLVVERSACSESSAPRKLAADVDRIPEQRGLEVHDLLRG